MDVVAAVAQYVVIVLLALHVLQVHQDPLVHQKDVQLHAQIVDATTVCAVKNAILSHVNAALIVILSHANAVLYVSLTHVNVVQNV